MGVLGEASLFTRFFLAAFDSICVGEMVAAGADMMAESLCGGIERPVARPTAINQASV